MAKNGENKERPLTQEETAQLLILNSMLVPRACKKNWAANKKLEELKEDEKLLEIVSNLERIKKSKGKNYITELGICLDKAMNDIAEIMKKYGKSKNNVGSSYKPPHDKVLPLLVQQVLFYIAVLLLEEGKSQKKVIDELRELNVNISHNFFSRMYITPKQYLKYLDIKGYKQPELPFTYKGQKNKETAVAIKNLVYQAGKYDIFCDIFGGSGAASLAVKRLKKAKYVYNELNEMTQNVFAIIADKNKYSDLIEELKALQIDLRCGKKWIDSNLDFCVKKHIGSRELEEKEKEILDNRKLQFSMTDAEKIKVMKKFRDAISSLDDGFPVSISVNKSYSKQDLLNKIFVDCDKYRDIALDNFKKSFGLIMILAAPEERNSLYFPVGNYYATAVDNNHKSSQIDLECVIKQYKQYRAYEYYCYFECILKNLNMLEHNDIRCAVAKIFMQAFSMYGDAQISKILRMRDDTYKTFENFVNKDFEKVITDMHNIVRGTIRENLDFREVIKKYSNSNYDNPIFYSDSPYISTSSYEEEFKEKDMEDLIHALKDSGARFIFSCRAVKSRNKSYNPSKEWRKKARNDNKSIFDSVFVNFIDAFDYVDDNKRQDLWLLAIEKSTQKKEHLIADLISDNREIEIMITNFKIYDFWDDAYPTTRFKVYEFSELLEELMLHANANVNSDWNKVWDKNWSVEVKEAIEKKER